MTPAEQAHLRILKIVDAEPEISQRQLAEKIGVSLGKANYLHKALLDKGHIKAGNFLRAEDKFKYAYLLTSEGIAAKLQLTRDYLARKEQEYVAMKTEIEAMRDELAREDEHEAHTRAQREEYKTAVNSLGKHPGGL
ncbi:MAG: MarR family EPS-associated transcriptional regulator [Gammaproteobacteria bacterium]|nr:MarR family EPS-associated transcriptional regulator [Gammaproteobacteria bacterium]